MTTEEMLQMLMNKIDSNHKQVMEKIDSNHAEVKADVARLEGKLNTVIADVAEIKADVRLLKEHDDVDTFNFNGAYKEIKEVNEKLDKVIADQKIHRRATQANINELQLQVNTLEDKLDKAS